jgi:ankyrin repeat protein
MFASSNGHREIVHELLVKGAKLNARDKEDITALMAASFEGHLEIVKELLENGAEINAKDKEGLTAAVVGIV